MKKGYCPIDGMVYTNNFPGRCALPAETFLIFKRNLWFVGNVVLLLYKSVHQFPFIFKWFMKKGYCHIDGKVYTDNSPGRCALPAETFLIFIRNLWFVENVMLLLYKYVH